MKKHSFLLAVAVFLLCGVINAQNIGLRTTSPQAPVHISSSGQVNTAGGLLVLGDTTEAHLEVDFDILQSNFGSVPLLLKLQPVGGNLNIGNGLLFADRTNNFVGINTIIPNTELQLHGEMRMTTAGLGTTQKDKLSIFGNLEEIATLGLGWIKNDSYETITQGGFPTDRSNIINVYEMYYKSEGAHRWFINQLANMSSPDMILSRDGDLGLGPADPGSKFHITNGYSASLSGKGYMQLGTTNSTNLVMDGNEILARSNGLASTLYLQYWGGNLSLCFPSNTGVGIGNFDPDSKLHITGGADASLSDHGYLITGSTTAANVVMDNNEMMARNNGASSPFYIQHDAGNLFLCGEENGQVGIGVETAEGLPDDTDFLLAVDGKIIAEEVRVELSGFWPDYVFEKNYTLKPLDKLNEEIKTLGHLPGIPSAAQVATEGFELGDMQRKLLEKIEELTLYVLELHNTNKALTQEIEILKSKVNGN